MNRTNKIILITRASTGFSNLTAKLLAKNGHTVYATMRDTNGGTTEIINDTSSKVQAGVLQNFGLSELTINN
jgi:NADP-dependent 3-hydroxy acid dehydrogenase YdfG